MMILGQKPAVPQAADTADIFSVSTADFEQRVIRASMAAPILLELWAPWCGPCKQLMPLLEAAVTASGGKVKLAKLNIDENQELSKALQVKSVPTVFAFFQGQPVTVFTGLRPANEIKMLVDQLVKMAAEASGAPMVDIKAVLEQAAAALAAGDLATAQELFGAVLAQDENNAAAYAGLIRTVLALGAVEEARHLIDSASPDLKKSAPVEAARAAVEMAESAGDAGDLKKLESAVMANPADLQARFDYGTALFAAGQKAQAVDQMIEIIRRDRKWEDDKGRLQLLKFIDAMGPADPETGAARRKLSSVLFS